MWFRRGSWVAQSVKHLTFGFGSGYDLVVHEFKPHIGFYAWQCRPCLGLSLSPSLLLPLLILSFSFLKINKWINKIKNKNNTWFGDVWSPIEGIGFFFLTFFYWMQIFIWYASYLMSEKSYEDTVNIHLTGLLLLQIEPLGHPGILFICHARKISILDFPT